ncbi:MAG: hypothetical protein ABSC05_12015 [Candidatus Solibacter sp.]|jgi:hypothetical protein
MKPVEIVYFGTAMFLALATLIKWKRRREVIAARLNRGLRGYVAGKSAALLPEEQKPPSENLIPA